MDTDMKALLTESLDTVRSSGIQGPQFSVLRCARRWQRHFVKQREDMAASIAKVVAGQSPVKQEILMVWRVLPAWNRKLMKRQKRWIAPSVIPQSPRMKLRASSQSASYVLSRPARTTIYGTTGACRCSYEG